jgi:hypothetical protein
MLSPLVGVEPRFVIFDFLAIVFLGILRDTWAL